MSLKKSETPSRAASPKEIDLKYILKFLDYSVDDARGTAIHAAINGSQYVLEMMLDSVDPRIHDLLTAQKNSLAFYQDELETLAIREKILTTQINLLKANSKQPETKQVSLSKLMDSALEKIRKELSEQYYKQKFFDSKELTVWIIQNDKPKEISMSDRRVATRKLTEYYESKRDSEIALHKLTEVDQELLLPQLEEYRQDTLKIQAETTEKKLTAKRVIKELKKKRDELQDAHPMIRSIMLNKLNENRLDNKVYSPNQLKKLSKLAKFTVVSANLTDPKTGCNLIHIALQNSQYHLFDYLYSKGVDINARSVRGIQAVDAQNAQGDTFLHYLVTTKQYEEAYKLISFGASCNIKNKKKEFVIDVYSNNKTILIDLLEKLGQADADTYLPILLKVLHDHCRISHFLTRTATKQTALDVLIKLPNTKYKNQIFGLLHSLIYVETFKSHFQVNIHYFIWLQFFCCAKAPLHTSLRNFLIKADTDSTLKMISELQTHLLRAKKYKSDINLLQYLQNNSDSFDSEFKALLDRYVEMANAPDVNEEYICRDGNDLGDFILDRFMNIIEAPNSPLVFEQPYLGTNSPRRLESPRHQSNTSDGTVSPRFQENGFNSPRKNSDSTKVQNEITGASRHKRFISESNMPRIFSTSPRTQTNDTSPLRPTSPVPESNSPRKLSDIMKPQSETLSISRHKRVTSESVIPLLHYQASDSAAVRPTSSAPESNSARKLSDPFQQPFSHPNNKRLGSEGGPPFKNPESPRIQNSNPEAMPTKSLSKLGTNHSSPELPRLQNDSPEASPAKPDASDSPSQRVPNINLSSILKRSNSTASSQGFHAKTARAVISSNAEHQNGRSTERSLSKSENRK